MLLLLSNKLGFIKVRRQQLHCQRAYHNSKLYYTGFIADWLPVGINLCTYFTVLPAIREDYRKFGRQSSFVYNSSAQCCSEKYSSRTMGWALLLKLITGRFKHVQHNQLLIKYCNIVVYVGFYKT